MTATSCTAMVILLGMQQGNAERCAGGHNVIAGLLDCLEQRFPGSQARCLCNGVPLSGSCWAPHTAQTGNSSRPAVGRC